MASGSFSGGALYSGPHAQEYMILQQNVAARSVGVLWREGSFYYISTPSMQGYVQTYKVSNISGSVTNHTPPTNETRYVGTTALAYLGNAITYARTPSPAYAQAVKYLGVKEGTLAFVEYTLVGESLKRRAWFPHANLIMNPPHARGRYVGGQTINDNGEKWKITSGWGGNDGHLGLDIRIANSSNAFLSNANARGKDVYAIADGKVVVSSDNYGGQYFDLATNQSYNGNGKCVIIEHTTPAGKKYYSTYSHLNSRNTTVNTYVAKHQIIGTLGSTGRVSGYGTTGAVVHLHLHITKGNLGTGANGYYRINGEEAYVPESSLYKDCYGTRYFNPTQYFIQGEASMIDNNYV